MILKLASYPPERGIQSYVVGSERRSSGSVNDARFLILIIIHTLLADGNYIRL